MDVHAPHQPVHSWRDFAIHLTIVTIGLFIALSLESLVEYVHHRHLVKEARENIRREIEDNHKAAQDDIELLQNNIAQQKANVTAIHGLKEHGASFHGSVQNSMSFESLSDSAWMTARDTGALGYMPYDEVQRYSDLYLLEQIINNTAIETGKLDFEAAAPFQMGVDIDKFPEQDYMQLLRENATVGIKFYTLQQFVRQFSQQCAEELKH